jgi:hypothetical protein
MKYIIRCQTLVFSLVGRGQCACYVPTKKVFLVWEGVISRIGTAAAPQGPAVSMWRLRISFEWLPLGARLWPNYLSLRAAPTCDNGFIALNIQELFLIIYLVYTYVLIRICHCPSPLFLIKYIIILLLLFYGTTTVPYRLIIKIFNGLK